MIVATVLTVYGIETSLLRSISFAVNGIVATVLTVYGIETLILLSQISLLLGWRLQQCLPFTVLKPSLAILKNSLIITSCNSAYRLRY